MENESKNLSEKSFSSTDGLCEILCSIADLIGPRPSSVADDTALDDMILLIEEMLLTNE